MNCFYHTETIAVGSCKSCNKGLCVRCASDAGSGLACADRCEEDVEQINELVERNKKIYGIGLYKSRMPSTGVLTWGLASVAMWLIVASLWLARGKIDVSLVVMAVAFTVVLGLNVYTFVRTGIHS